MLIRDIATCQYLRFTDQSILCALLHPDLAKRCRRSWPQCCPRDRPGKRIDGSPTAQDCDRTLLYYLGNRKDTYCRSSSTVRGRQVILIAPQNVQYIENTGKTDFSFLCIVLPPSQESDEEIAG